MSPAEEWAREAWEAAHPEGIRDPEACPHCAGDLDDLGRCPSCDGEDL